MTASELIRLISVHVLRDVASPRLWSDDALRTWINEAQSEFVAAVLHPTQRIVVTVLAGDSSVQLPQGVIELNNVQYADGTTLDGLAGEPLPSKLGDSVTAAGVDYLSTLLYLDAPVATDTELYVTGVFEPTPIGAVLDGALTVPLAYQGLLADYVAYKALSNNDSEAGNQPGPARDAFGRWQRTIQSARARLSRRKVGRVAIATGGGFI